MNKHEGTGQDDEEGGATTSEKRAAEVDLLLGGAEGRAAASELAEADAVAAEAERKLRADSGRCPMDGGGLKWSLSWFRNWLAEQGGDWMSVSRSIDALIAKTLVSAQPHLSHV